MLALDGAAATARAYADALADTGSSGEPALRARPLIVDLDGTLLLSDILIEGFFALVAANPLAALFSLGALRHGVAAFKARIAANTIDLATLPWNFPFNAWLKAEHARSRGIYLASAADRLWVEATAAHFGWFAGWFASDGRINLKGYAKADALCQAFGEKGFDYAGNGSADVAVWENAAGVVLVSASSKLQRKVRSRWPTSIRIDAPKSRSKSYAQAIRVHQWLKNLSVCLVAFLSFSLCASSVYLLNDLIDVGRDRTRIPLSRTALPRPHSIGFALMDRVASCG
jgi:hypothetical protein